MDIDRAAWVASSSVGYTGSTVSRVAWRRQLEVLRAYIRAGSVAAAAYELGISETTVRQHLSGLYRRTGCLNAAQAAYWLGSRQLDSEPALPGRPALDPLTGARRMGTNGRWRCDD